MAEQCRQGHAVYIAIGAGEGRVAVHVRVYPHQSDIAARLMRLRDA